MLRCDLPFQHAHDWLPSTLEIRLSACLRTCRARLFATAASDICLPACHARLFGLQVRDGVCVVATIVCSAQDALATDAEIFNYFQE